MPAPLRLSLTAGRWSLPFPLLALARLQALRAPAGFMASQPHINDKMRAILHDWLVDVCLKYRQTPETLHLTWSLVDRYLARTVIQRNRLQLLGVAATLVASKFEQCFRYEVRRSRHSSRHCCCNCCCRCDVNC